MKKLIQFLFQRVVFVALGLILQVFVLIMMIWKFHEYFVYFYIICIVLSFIALLYLINCRSNPGYKIAWMIPILLFPIFGGLFYILFGGNRLSKRQQKKMSSVQNKLEEQLNQDENIMKQLNQENSDAYLQANYVWQTSHYPIYQKTNSTYFPVGEEYHKALLEELKKAKHYIFLEFFIIRAGKMWDSILEILKQKVTEGVDVRVIFDDMGCIMTLPYHYEKKLRSYGIKCYPFNPFIPVLSSRLNNRDHRKIVVIDGHTGFVGGINLADEYINAEVHYGHWKDNGLMIKGAGVWNLSVMFLSMWDYITGGREEFSNYHPERHQLKEIESDGFIQPYCDSPLDNEATGENIYLNMINRAKQYIYITTPYLIIDNEMITALINAAKCGIEVKIITPGIADKKIVNEVTKAYYEVLIENGVEIFEYIPGFIHAKTFVVDDLYATVGSVNLDYRSLYLHFECGIWLYKSDTIHEIRRDLDETLEKCRKVQLKETRKITGLRKLYRAILRVFAPLM